MKYQPEGLTSHDIILLIIFMYTHTHTYADTGRISLQRASSAIFGNLCRFRFCLADQECVQNFLGAEERCLIGSVISSYLMLGHSGRYADVGESKIDGKTYQTIYGLTGFAS